MASVMVTQFLVGISLGIILGLVLLLAGGIAVTPAPPPCHGCAVLAQPFGGCDEAVQGGWVCP